MARIRLVVAIVRHQMPTTWRAMAYSGGIKIESHLVPIGVEVDGRCGPTIGTIGRYQYRY
jgi:hypothetical protein